MGLQPSPGRVFPSSQASVDERKPSPQTPVSVPGGCAGTHWATGEPCEPVEPTELLVLPEPDVPPLLTPPRSLCGKFTTILVVLGKDTVAPCGVAEVPDAPDDPAEPDAPLMPAAPALGALLSGVGSQPASGTSNRKKANAKIRTLQQSLQRRDLVVIYFNSRTNHRRFTFAVRVLIQVPLTPYVVVTSSSNFALIVGRAPNFEHMLRILLIHLLAPLTHPGVESTRGASVFLMRRDRR